MDSRVAVSSLNAIASILGDIAYVVFIGVLFAQRWLAAPAFLPVLPRLRSIVNRRGLLAPLALLGFAHLVKPWFVASSMSGSTNFRENLLLVPSILSSTHAGKLWCLGSFAILVLTFLIARSNRGVIWQWFAIGAICLLAFIKAGSSHAADEGDFTLTEMLQTVHILATATWAGPILLSGFAVLPNLVRTIPPALVWEYGKRLSRVATCSIGIIIVTGVYSSDRELSGTLSGLWMSTWGRILIVKVTFVLIALMLGAASRYLYLRNHATRERSCHLRNLVFSEAIAMLAILCLSGLLGNTAPAMAM